MRGSETISAVPTMQHFQVLHHAEPVRHQLMSWSGMREVRDLKQHYLTVMVSYQTLILASADILLIRMATVLQSLQRVWIPQLQQEHSHPMLARLRQHQAVYSGLQERADIRSLFLKDRQQILSKHISRSRQRTSDMVSLQRQMSQAEWSFPVQSMEFILTADAQTEYRPWQQMETDMQSQLHLSQALIM